MEKPDIKQVGLNIAEDAAKSVLTNIVKPFAEYYIADQLKVGGIDIGPVLKPFIEQLLAEAVKMADKIDGEVG